MEIINKGTKESLEGLLSVVIATYNHSSLLDNTLKALLDSPVKNCRITVLNNHSTDDTLKVCENYIDKFKRLEVYTQPVNLGGGAANYIHSIEFCNTEYIWQLADDDQYDFTHFDDVIGAIISKKYDIIQVGAHNEGSWDWGMADTPRNFLNRGYDYFRFSSFLPCSIFRYNYYVNFIKEAYAAISLWYPHMPCLIHAYLDDILVYLSKTRIVTAVIGAQSYSVEIPFKGFILLADLLPNRLDKEKCVNAQMPGRISTIFLKFLYHHYFQNCTMYETPWLYYYKLYKVGSLIDKLIILLGFFPVIILRSFTNKK